MTFVRNTDIFFSSCTETVEDAEGKTGWWVHYSPQHVPGNSEKSSSEREGTNAESKGKLRPGRSI